MSYFQKALKAAEEKAASLAKEKEGVRNFTAKNTSNNQLNMIAYCDSKR